MALLCAAQVQGWAGRELLLGVSVMLGVVRAFQMPAQQALAPMLVPPAMLPPPLRPPTLASVLRSRTMFPRAPT